MQLFSSIKRLTTLVVMSSGSSSLESNDLVVLPIRHNEMEFLKQLHSHGEIRVDLLSDAFDFFVNELINTLYYIGENNNYPNKKPLF